MKTATEVLLVDDNLGDAELTADLLKRNDRSVHTHSVTDGVQAMAYLRCQGKYSDALRPHLIMLDLNMPRKDGWAVLVDVKSDSALNTIPLVVFTTSEARTDIVRCYELGANSYVTKPGDLDRYRATVTGIGNYWFGFASLLQQEGY
ncbi:MAG TPA: response regulator [Candidatus Acidoferrum sp.]|nr:response regulator [Candidatus Acidoferrum sp.]